MTISSNRRNCELARFHAVSRAVRDDGQYRDVAIGDINDSAVNENLDILDYHSEICPSILGSVYSGIRYPANPISAL